MPIGLPLIVYQLVSVLTLIAAEIVPIGLASIMRMCPGFDIDRKVKLSCTWLDKGLQNPYRVGHLLQVKLTTINICEAPNSSNNLVG